MNYGLFAGFPLQASANINHGAAKFGIAETGSFFLVPDGVTELTVLAIGGGGGGAGGSSSYGGQGGFQGEIVVRRVAVLPGQKVRVTIGAGGGAGGATANGYAGGSTTFGSLVTAAGGAGGALPGTTTIPGAQWGQAGGDGLGRGGPQGSGVGDAASGWGAGGGGGGYHATVPYAGGNGSAGGILVWW